MHMRELRFGVELEMAGLSELRAAEAMQDAVGGHVQSMVGDRFAVTDREGRRWQVKPDGSIDASQSAEIASPPLRYEDLPMLQRVARAVRAAGARANRSCGIHVHVDAGCMDSQHLVNLSKLVYNYEDHLYRALGVRQYRRLDYCRPVEEDYIDELMRKRPRSLDALRDIWYPTNGDDYIETESMYNYTRYHGLNLHAVWYHGTVEFRYYNGSLHAGVIKAYVQLALALAAYAGSAKSIQLGKRPIADEHVLPVFRALLMRVGLRGREFHNTRYHLLRRLGANMRPVRAPRAERVTQTA